MFSQVLGMPRRAVQSWVSPTGRLVDEHQAKRQRAGGVEHLGGATCSGPLGVHVISSSERSCSRSCSVSETGAVAEASESEVEADAEDSVSETGAVAEDSEPEAEPVAEDSVPQSPAEVVTQDPYHLEAEFAAEVVAEDLYNLDTEARCRGCHSR